MELAIMILKEEELLDTLIKRLTSNDIKNITVLESDTFISENNNKNRKKDVNIFGSIRYMLDYFNDESRLIFIPIKNDRVDIVKNIVKDLIPSHQYLFFTIPMNNMEGNLE
ncbi:MAG: hypothetical protein E7169_02420 [Firmicutes bacterium]|nr:hypothetical protein [Bacillota bacterium]